VTGPRIRTVEARPARYDKAGYYDETEEMRHDARTSVVCGSP
jgi:hypothetical protein